jgi:hypothetical protein
MLKIELYFWPAEADVPAIYAARAGSTQETGSSPSEALAALADKLARSFPRPMPKGNLFVEEGAG